MSKQFKLSEMRFTNGKGEQVVIHVDDGGQVVWSGQFGADGKSVPLARLSKPQTLRFRISEGKKVIAAGLCCRPDGKGGWICKPC